MRIGVKTISLKTKLCILTVLLVGVVMLFVGYTVIEQQRSALLLQMEGTGSFLVKNLAQNVVEPLLAGDSLSLSNLITSLEARDLMRDNPARFTEQEYNNFLTRYLLENKTGFIDSAIKRTGQNVYVEVGDISDAQLKKIGKDVLQEVLNVIKDFDTQPQYEKFLEQYPWTKGIMALFVKIDASSGTFQMTDLSKQRQDELTQQVTDKIFEEILSRVRNPFIGYAIVVDKDEIIRAHPVLDKFVGEKYVWPEGTEPLKEGQELKIQRCLYQGEPHYDFVTPVFVQDKNIGKALVGSVHIGLREAYVLKDIEKAKTKIIYVTLIAIILGSTGAYMLAALIVKPIKGLVRDAEILGGGDLDHHIQVKTYDEVGILATTLDETRVKLKNAQEQLIASERLARELEIAREIQVALLPKETPYLEKVELGALYRSAEQVGGDLYDFFWVSEGELGIVVADVSGKGVPGSLVMTMAKAVLRAKAIKSDAPDHTLPVGQEGGPASVIRKANQMISHDIKKGMFITANYGILNVASLRFNFVSAGHNDTFVYNSQTGDLRQFNPKGIALGLDKGTLFDKVLQDQEVFLAPGDLLVQYTDGVSEAMNQHGEEFGEDRLKLAIQRYAHLHVDEFLASLDEEIRAFTEGFLQSDDITVVAIKAKG